MEIEYVTYRKYYSAPELLLNESESNLKYLYAMDMWSIGCVFADLLLMEPGNCPHYSDRIALFEGRNELIVLIDSKEYPINLKRAYLCGHQKLKLLSHIFQVLGLPERNTVNTLYSKNTQALHFFDNYFYANPNLDLKEKQLIETTNVIKNDTEKNVKSEIKKKDETNNVKSTENKNKIETDEKQEMMSENETNTNV